MAKTENQKKKLLLVKEYLEKHTDADHPASSAQILEYLALRGVEAERKSIGADIQALNDFGMDIQTVHRGRYSGYYLAWRLFEPSELKLLIDAVQSSRFLTEKKSLALIRKLASLASSHEAGLLQRQLVVSGRVKTMNESIFYHVDAIHEAISQNRRISFTYSDFGMDGKRHPRPLPYQASPYALCWADENYYLIAHSDHHGLTHYRVDKMGDIQLLPEPRCMDSYGQMNLAAYSRQVFHMFNGPVSQVKLRFHKSLAGVVIDRFGSDSMLIPDGDDHFLLTADVAISPNFWGWLAGLGNRAMIVYPKPLQAEFCAFCRESLAQYEP